MKEELLEGSYICKDGSPPPHRNHLKVFPSIFVPGWNIWD